MIRGRVHLYGLAVMKKFIVKIRKRKKKENKENTFLKLFVPVMYNLHYKMVFWETNVLLYMSSVEFCTSLY